MGFKLDAIVSKILFGSLINEQKIGNTINSSGFSLVVDASGTEQGYLVSLDYFDGVGTIDIDFFLQGSEDGLSWGQIPNTLQTITDASGNIIWDVVNSNANFVRVGWTATSGTMDVFSQFSGKRRH